MSYLTTNQDALIISLNTGINLSGAQSVSVRYRKPDGTTGQWPASIDGESIRKVMIPEGEELDQPGLWAFWSYVVFANNTFAEGEPVTQKVYDGGRL